MGHTALPPVGESEKGMGGWGEKMDCLLVGTAMKAAVVAEAEKAATHHPAWALKAAGPSLCGNS